MFRGLIHHWRINLAVALACAVATAVLTGALLVGDSVRGSLRDLTLDRLGNIHHALLSHNFFRAGLADDLAAAGAVPAIVVRGSAIQPDSGSRASSVSIQGVDERFDTLFEGIPSADDGGLFGPRVEGQVFPSAVLNESLARELEVTAGDALLLNLGTWDQVPRDTLMGRDEPENVLARMRVTVSRIVPDRGVGRFGLFPHQAVTRNAYVPLRQLQRALGQRGLVNTVLLPSDPEDPDALLEQAVTLEDLGLAFDHGEDYVSVESGEFVLRPWLDEAIGETAATLGRPILRVQSYVTNSVTAGDRMLPYSLVVAVESPGWGNSTLELTDGSPAPALGEDELLVNTWVAEDLGVGAGDSVDVGYYVVGPREELLEDSRPFRVAGVVALTGLGADRDLVPDYPGLHDADDISSWDPPFPVDLELIRDKDERYWDDYGTTPKIFFSEATGAQLWATRYGSTTAIRVGTAGDGVADTERLLRDALGERLTAASFGLSFRPVRRQGLAASSGATDFSMLFISFSFFLIVAAALLVGLLFGLAVEHRAREVGLLRAVGYPLRKVRLRFLLEGQLLAACGALFGVALGIGYAALMMLGLRTLWVGAVGSSELALHVNPVSLVVGWLIANLVVTVSILGSVIRLGRVSPPALLAGSFTRGRRGGARRRSLWVGLIAGLGGLGLFATALITGAETNPGLVFGSGALLLIAGLAAFSYWCREPGARRGTIGGATARMSMAARNSAWAPGRSLLSVALVASAAFVIVAVAANHHTPGDELERKDSGTGGYALVAESDVPLYQDLNRAEDREELGFASDSASVLEQAGIIPLRFLPGDDASCLNLYQPEKPQLLGVPPEMVERGGFAFSRTAELAEGETNPWILLDTELEDGAIPAFADANSAQWILHKMLGDDIEMENEFGQPIRLRLVGLMSTSIFQSELLISEERFREHFPGRTGYRYFLIDAPQDPAAVARTLESTLAPYGFDSTSTRERVIAFKAIENTYMSTFELLGGLGLLLGTVGLGIVLLRNVVERRGELATLRAFGYPRSSLVWIVLAENLFLLLVGVGVGAGSALIAVAPRLATIHVDWLSLALTLGVVLAVGMLSSVLAVRGALRIPLLPALKAER